MKNVIDAKHPTYEVWLSDSLLPRSLMDGTKEMQNQGETFLFKNTYEPQKDYDNRLKRTILFNAFKKTVTFFSGQVYQKAIVFDESMPEEILGYNTDIDLSGNSINVFAKRVLERGLAEGVSHIIVESNNKDGQYTTRAEEKEAGIRPYFREVLGKSIFAWKVEDGQLTQIRINESVEEPNGEFGVNIINQIRVYEIGSWKVYRQNKKSNDYSLYDSGVNNLLYIPIVSYIPGEQSSLITGDSPLMDLAELNLEHWQSKSDQKNILHEARVPLKFSKMLDLSVLKNSPHTIINSNDENADLKYVEINGKSIEAGQKDLTEIEAKMALYGLQQLIQKTGTQTATEKALTSSESNSALQLWAIEQQTILRDAYSIVADYLKVTLPDDSLTVNQEYSLGSMTPELINAFAKMVETNIISASSAFKEIQKKGFVSEDLDWLDVEIEIDKERQNSTSLINFNE